MKKAKTIDQLATDAANRARIVPRSIEWDYFRFGFSKGANAIVRRFKRQLKG